MRVHPLAFGGALLAWAWVAIGARAADPLTRIPTDRRVAIIAAADPAFNGIEMGFTVFGNESWFCSAPPFDLNALVLAESRSSLNRPARLVHGRDLGLLRAADAKRETKAETSLLATRLGELGKEWSVDMILLVQSGSGRDFIGLTRQALSGVGYYTRGPNRAIFAVWWVRVFDCRTGKFTASERIQSLQRSSGVPWAASWEQLTTESRRVITREVNDLIRNEIPLVLAKAGLSDAPPPPKKSSLASALFLPPVRQARSFLPEGDILPIPTGVSVAAARYAVQVGFVDRRWTVTENTPTRVVGVYRDDEKEAVCAVTIDERAVTLHGEGFKYSAKGERTPVGVYRRWHRNLKESIYRELEKVPAASESNEETEANPATPQPATP